MHLRGSARLTTAAVDDDYDNDHDHYHDDYNYYHDDCKRAALVAALFHFGLFKHFFAKCFNNALCILCQESQSAQSLRALSAVKADDIVVLSKIKYPRLICGSIETSQGEKLWVISTRQNLDGIDTLAILVDAECAGKFTNWSAHFGAFAALRSHLGQLPLF